MILKPEIFLHLYSIEILADDILEKSFLDSFLSNIDKLDLVQLQFEIQLDKLSLSQVLPLEKKKDKDSTINIEQLWILDYGDNSNPVCQIINSLQKNRH